MKNYADMGDFEINSAVASALGVDFEAHETGVYASVKWGGDNVVSVAGIVDYCNNWADAGPVIDEIFSSLTSTGKYDDGIGFGERDMTVWQAQMHHNKCGKLRAAMIVFLMMKDNETRIIAPDEVSDE